MQDSGEMARKQSKPSKELVFVTMANIGRAIVLAQTAECLLNSMMSMFPDRSLMKNSTVEGIEKLSEKEKKRTFGQLVRYITKILKSDKSDLFKDFLEDRNSLVHRLTNRYGAKLDTDEGVEKANKLAIQVIQSACINIVTFFRGVRVLAQRLQQMSARDGKDLDISDLVDDIDKLFRATVHPVMDSHLEKLFDGVGFNWRDPKNDGGFK
jgi:hypothetical protein